MINRYDDAMILMSCDKGQDTPLDERDGFLIHLAEELKQLGILPTVSEMFLAASKKYVDKQKENHKIIQEDFDGKPRMYRSEPSKDILIPSSTSKPSESDEQDSQ
ncbi:hypothetical protein EB796_011340 [Bugula neritina]|uniref:Uncharacterized protein n=1 Tax=Bugula neritina TaxID=10212 RepID=A0A7J7JWV5_BUGNE|nr:hypothetical protein EB796_011340 [Bugula neritina]